MTKIDAPAESAAASTAAAESAAEYNKCVFRCIALALVVILRCVLPICGVRFQSYGHFKNIITTWLNLNPQVTATQPPRSLQAAFCFIHKRT